VCEERETRLPPCTYISYSHPKSINNLRSPSFSFLPFSYNGYIRTVGVMLLAEGTVIEVSGVLSVVTLGLTMAAKGKYFISTV
jgi:hypothetical protein